MFRFAVKVLAILTIAGAASGQYTEEDDIVVADAVFRGVYIGIVRMVQRVNNDGDGDRSTNVMVRLGHPNNDSVTNYHMWHVEHYPITGVDCAESNKHFAPFGITKITNYTQFCSNVTPDFCEIGDISTKTTLTSVGAGTNNVYEVPLLPLVGPYTVIGHSVNIHGGSKSKKRQACANIVLNKRETKAKLIDIKVKITDPMDVQYVNDARRKMAKLLMIPLAKIQTAGGLSSLQPGCRTITFLIFDRDISYDENKLRAIQMGKIDIGPLTPIGCVIDGEVVAKPSDPEKPVKKDTKPDQSITKPCEQDNRSQDYQVTPRYPTTWTQSSVNYRNPGPNRNDYSGESSRPWRSTSQFGGWDTGSRRTQPGRYVYGPPMNDGQKRQNEGYGGQAAWQGGYY